MLCKDSVDTQIVSRAERIVFLAIGSGLKFSNCGFPFFKIIVCKTLRQNNGKKKKRHC